MKVYIAGAITGNPNYKEQFAAAEKRLTDLGFVAVNPVKPEGLSYKEYIDMGLSELMRCDGIYLLKGWSRSNGANLEATYAVTVSLYCFSEAFDDAAILDLKEKWEKKQK